MNSYLNTNNTKTGQKTEWTITEKLNLPIVSQVTKETQAKIPCSCFLMLVHHEWFRTFIFPFTVSVVAKHIDQNRKFWMNMETINKAQCIMFLLSTVQICYLKCHWSVSYCCHTFCPEGYDTCLFSVNDTFARLNNFLLRCYLYLVLYSLPELSSDASYFVHNATETNWK